MKKLILIALLLTACRGHVYGHVQVNGDTYTVDSYGSDLSESMEDWTMRKPSKEEIEGGGMGRYNLPMNARVW